ncbi:hypothetical protein SAMN03159343_3443 [Klenkia marina]|uniref:Uncharacterized protein n=1 Tax=Klenkia marina TaxID=1960309 RepID=A0A1G4YSZ0_9ACTN|nr:hypothetical protein [Klenkia marina]SCX56546.1 hypothetical protein SAMN03159343_3443 [Klenkia marina]
MDRTAAPVSTRTLLWGVVAPLLVGSFVPALSGPALVWLLAGLATLFVQAASGAVRRADPGEDDGEDDAWDAWEAREAAAQDDPDGDRAAPVRVPAVPGRWWNRPLENPNTAAARAGSWG